MKMLLVALSALAVGVGTADAYNNRPIQSPDRNIYCYRYVVPPAQSWKKDGLWCFMRSTRHFDDLGNDVFTAWFVPLFGRVRKSTLGATKQYPRARTIRYIRNLDAPSVDFQFTNPANGDHRYISCGMATRKAMMISNGQRGGILFLSKTRVRVS